MLINSILKLYPFFLGTWILRSTNDNTLLKGLTYIIMNDDESIKLRTLNKEGVFGTKKSINGKIININPIDNSNFIINIKYLYLHKYSYSFIGIEIPEFKFESTNCIINKNLHIKFLDRSILITDTKLPYYYLFDLYIGKIQYPYTETGLNTFIFTQFISFILNLILAKILHDTSKILQNLNT